MLPAFELSRGGSTAFKGARESLLRRGPEAQRRVTGLREGYVGVYIAPSKPPNWRPGGTPQTPPQGLRAPGLDVRPDLPSGAYLIDSVYSAAAPPASGRENRLSSSSGSTSTAVHETDALGWPLKVLATAKG